MTQDSTPQHPTGAPAVLLWLHESATCMLVSRWCSQAFGCMAHVLDDAVAKDQTHLESQSNLLKFASC